MKKFEFVDGLGLDTAQAYRLLVGCVVPRPIAWVTTVDGQGRVNAAPFSSYNYVATDPPMLAINITSKGDVLKDTARNIRESREFVVNVATQATMDQMHASAAEYPPDMSETDALNIELLPSTRVRPPRIAASPVQMECKLDQFIVLGKGRNTLYIGEIVGFHLSTDIYDGQRVDSVAMQPVARLGGPFYAALGEIFNRPMLQRPPGGEGWIRQASSSTHPKD
jgi:flavin reductase (DIM6/NTAB) family NADH-FMN oxidoreductase RutF